MADAKQQQPSVVEVNTIKANPQLASVASLPNNGVLWRIISLLKMNINGRIAVRISYVNACSPVFIGFDLAMAAAANPSSGWKVRISPDFRI